jgi:hypothetical protein
MKRILLTLIATAALAAPTAAFAHGGWRHHHHGHGLYAKLTGTGTSFSGNTATASGTIAKGTLLDSGTFNASLTMTWSSATTKTFARGTLSCAPATASLNVAGTTGNTVASTLTGKTCSFTKTDGTVVRAFFGKGTADGAGSLAGLDGTRAKLWLVQKADGSVKGAVWAGSRHRH